jgi:SAM-dependent methyltransferase
MAYRHPVEVRMTDLDAANVEPYALIWGAIKRSARGTASFGTLDVRRLALPDRSSDVVYALSVLEHVEGKGQDAAAAAEMARVLKPGGLLLLTVPFGPRYEEQWIQGIAHAGRRTRRSDLSFFQRIYDRPRFENLILGPLRIEAEDFEIITVYRRASGILWIVHALRAGLPESVLTALGAANPLLSLALNRHLGGVRDAVPARYGRLHRFGDIYADLIVAARKKGVPGRPAR